MADRMTSERCGPTHRQVTWSAHCASRSGGCRVDGAGVPEPTTSARRSSSRLLPVKMPALVFSRRRRLATPIELAEGHGILFHEAGACLGGHTGGR